MKNCILFSFLYISLLYAQPSAWTSKGIGGGGALFSPSINPNNSQEIYMACDMSELFYSTNQGENWQEKHFLDIQGGHGAEMQFTSNNQIRYCLDYSSIQGVDEVHAAKSLDGGNTWQTLSNEPDPFDTPYGLYANYFNANQLILSYYDRVYFSNDGGNSFTLIHTCLDNGAGVRIAGVFWNGNAIYIGTNDGILSSSNGGSSFAMMATTGIPAGQYIAGFAGAVQNGQTRFFCLVSSDVYAGIVGSDYWYFMDGVYAMDNANGTWTQKMSGIQVGADFPFFLGMAHNDISTAYLAGGSASSAPIVLKTNDGGNSWTDVFLTNNNQNIATGWCGQGGTSNWGYAESPFGFQVNLLNKDELIMTDYGFAHISTNGGTSWKQLYLSSADQNPANQPISPSKNYKGNGLENTSSWQIFWESQSHILSAYSDIRASQSVDGGTSWKAIPGSPQNSTYRYVKKGNRIYGCTSSVHDMYQSTYLTDAKIDNGTGTIIYSKDNGNSFQTMKNFQSGVVWIAADPTNANKLYAAVAHSTYGGIWFTNNLQDSTFSNWLSASKPPRTEGHPFNIIVLNDGSLVASFSGRRTSTGFSNSSGVFWSGDGGNSWADRSDPNMQWWTKDVIVDPHDPSQNTWYAAVFAGWGNVPQGTGGIYKTTNRGLTWTQINNEYRVNSMTIHPSNPNIMYYTTETNGLWYTDDLNATSPTFTRVQSYDFRHPVRVFFNPYDDNEIWVSSFGNGMKVGNTYPTDITDNLQGAAFLYPNPSKGKFKVQIGTITREKVLLTLYDLAGEQVFQAEVSDSNQELEPPLSSGIYMWRIQSKGYEAKGKWIKQ